MESTSGTPLGTLRLGRRRPSVWCCYSGRIEHRDIIGLGKSSKFQWSWWAFQTENENTGLCILFSLAVKITVFVKRKRKKKYEVVSVCFHISYHSLFFH